MKAEELAIVLSFIESEIARFCKEIENNESKIKSLKLKNENNKKRIDILEQQRDYYINQALKTK